MHRDGSLSSTETLVLDLLRRNPSTTFGRADITAKLVISDHQARAAVFALLKASYIHCPAPYRFQYNDRREEQVGTT